jgi:anti-sigma B factor antagonist
MKPFEARTSAEHDRVVVTLAGECDLSVRDKLTVLLLEAVNSAEVVAVDLAGLTFMDSSGLHALMTGHRAAQQAGRRLYATGAVGVVAALLDLTGLDAVLSPSVTDSPNDPAGAASRHE